jgi:hypothetical protein
VIEFSKVPVVWTGVPSARGGGPPYGVAGRASATFSAECGIYEHELYGPGGDGVRARVEATVRDDLRREIYGDAWRDASELARCLDKLRALAVAPPAGSALEADLLRRSVELAGSLVKRFGPS